MFQAVQVVILCVFFSIGDAETTTFRSSAILPLQETSVTECPWLPNKIKCIKKSLDLNSIGCTNGSGTVLQKRNSKAENVSQTAVSKECMKNNSRQISCNVTKQPYLWTVKQAFGNEKVGDCNELFQNVKLLTREQQICKTWGSWSKWTTCCNKESCVFEHTGPIFRYKKARYRNISEQCKETFSFEQMCATQIQINPCEDLSRRVDPGSNPDNQEGIAIMTKVALFCFAGVILVALFGFAGSRVARIMHSKQPLARQPSNVSQVGEDSLNYRYSNVNYRPNGRAAGNESRPRTSTLSSLQPQSALAASRLSTIAEEDVCSSCNVKETDAPACVTSSENTEETVTNVTNHATPKEDVNMNGDRKVSVANQDGLLHAYGWNPRARSEIEVQKLKDSSVECLAASDLSLASAELLHAALPSDASSVTTSSYITSSSEDSYSLQDISDTEMNVSKLTHAFTSLPDVTLMKECIPDIEEVLNAEEISN